MDLKQIQELIKLVKKNEIGELKVKEGDFAITIKNQGTNQVVYSTSAQAPVAVSKQDVSTTDTVVKPEAVVAATNENLFTFRSPMVGTFYRKPGLDKDTFVKVGDTVKTGVTLCIIEAMKLFNEIEFDGVEGKIVKVLCDDASPVEYDQPLFLIEKV